MSHKIDVHVLTHSGTRRDWLEQCLASLEPEPCNVFVVRGVEGHIGQGRADGYSRGAAPYVAFVDSDDYVLPGAFSVIEEAMATSRAVTTREKELVVWPNGDERFSGRGRHNHHIKCFRREDVIPLIPLMKQTTRRCDRMMDYVLNPTRVDFEGYVWRNHGDGAHFLPAIEAELMLWIERGKR